MPSGGSDVAPESSNRPAAAATGVALPDEVGLSVVIPCNNVDHVCAEVLAELGQLDLEVIFVGDGSRPRPRPISRTRCSNTSASLSCSRPRSW